MEPSKCRSKFPKISAMYYLYILQCADGSLYTGITVDLERRVREHNGLDSAPGKVEKGAKYTRSRRPVKAVFSKRFRSRSRASMEEARVKKLSREEKLEMIETI